jgi:hypothetical protein
MKRRSISFDALSRFRRRRRTWALANSPSSRPSAISAPPGDDQRRQAVEAWPGQIGDHALLRLVRITRASRLRGSVVVALIAVRKMQPTIDGTSAARKSVFAITDPGLIP